MARRRDPFTLRLLLSFHYYRDVPDLERFLGLFGPSVDLDVFVDSGAFSAVTTGAVVELDDYVAWAQDHAALFSTVAALDVIGDADASYANAVEMERRGVRVVPAYHINEPWSALERLCERWPYVALGGMVTPDAASAPTMRWLVRCHEIGQRYGTRFHGFGQTTRVASSAFGFYSVDSSSWNSAWRFGTLFLWDDLACRFQRVRCGTRAVLDHQQLVRAHHGDPILLATPRCGLTDEGKDIETVRHERSELTVVNMAAWRRFECFLRQRHGDQEPPEGWERSGPLVYLADGSLWGERRYALDEGITPGVVRAAQRLAKEAPQCVP